MFLFTLKIHAHLIGFIFICIKKKKSHFGTVPTYKKKKNSYYFYPFHLSCLPLQNNRATIISSRTLGIKAVLETTTETRARADLFDYLLWIP